MAVIYNHYYIGEMAAVDGFEGLDSPVLLTMSYIKNGRVGEIKQHSHPFMEVFLFESGRGLFESGDNRLELEAGDVLVVSAGKKHVQYSYDNTPLTYYGFAATRVGISTLSAPDSFSDDGFVLLKQCAHDFKPLISACKRELDGKTPGCYAAASAYFKLLLIEIARLIKPKSVQSALTRSGEIKTYIEAHCDEDVNLSMLCKHFYTNKSNLLHSFKAEFGISPMRYLNLYRIERSKKLLASGLSVTDAAASVGFSNPVYFSELFHRQTGLTPSSFKKIANNEIPD